MFSYYNNIINMNIYLLFNRILAWRRLSTSKRWLIVKTAKIILIWFFFLDTLYLKVLVITDYYMYEDYDEQNVVNRVLSYMSMMESFSSKFEYPKLKFVVTGIIIPTVIIIFCGLLVELFQYFLKFKAFFFIYFRNF